MRAGPPDDWRRSSRTAGCLRERSCSTKRSCGRWRQGRRSIRCEVVERDGAPQVVLEVGEAGGAACELFWGRRGSRGRCRGSCGCTERNIVGQIATGSVTALVPRGAAGALPPTFWIGHPGARVGLVRRLDGVRRVRATVSGTPVCVNDLQQRHAMVDRRQLREQRQAEIALSSKTSTRNGPFMASMRPRAEAPANQRLYKE